MRPRTDVGDLALLSDCQTAAIVSRDGSVCWWPGQRFDGPSAFSALLDPDAGHFDHPGVLRSPDHARVP